MQQVDKVIRIPMNSSDFYLTISNDLSEWWFDYDDLIENDEVLNFVNNYDVDIIEQLKNGNADYLAIYSDN